MELLRLNVVGEAHLYTVTGKVVCSYPRCGKSGHTLANCWKKKKDQKTAQLKRAGRKVDHRSTQQGTPRRSSSLRDNGSGGCFVCGSEEHRAFACPNRARLSKTEKDRKITFNAAAGEQKQERPQIGADWNKYLKRGEKDSDEESDEIHMMLSYSCGNVVEDVRMAEDDGYVFLDSCASKTTLYCKRSVCSRRVDSDYMSRSTIVLLRIGKFKDWKEIRVCHDAVTNICSAGMLREMGYGLQLLRVPRVVRLVDGMEVLTASYIKNGMPFVGLVELLNLPNINNGEILEEVHLTGKCHADPLGLLQERCGHFSKVKLSEAFKHMLFTGSGLVRRYLTRGYKKTISRHLCKSCAKAKITRRSFQPSGSDLPQGSK